MIKHISAAFATDATNFRRLRGFVVVVLASLVTCGQAVAQATLDELVAMPADLGNGTSVFRLCADCHGTEGQGTWDGGTPVISGQHQRVLIKQLRDFRDGRRQNDAMYPFSQDDAIGGDQAIVDVTAYISTLLMPDSPATGPGQELDEGRALYQQHCMSCHGENGAGIDAAGYPRIHGQHYPYLVRQLADIAEGRRFDSNPAMKAALASLSINERNLIADYLSRERAEEHLMAPEDWQNPDFSSGF